MHLAWTNEAILNGIASREPSTTEACRVSETLPISVNQSTKMGHIAYHVYRICYTTFTSVPTSLIDIAISSTYDVALQTFINFT